MNRTTAVLAAAALLPALVGFANASADQAAPTASAPQTSTVTETAPNGDVTTTTTTIYPCDGAKQVTVIQVQAPLEDRTTTTTERCSTETRRSASIAASATAEVIYGDVYAPEVDFTVFSSNGPAPTGDVEVLVDGKVVKTVPVAADGSGRATLPRTLPVGTHKVDLRYTGDENTKPTDLKGGKGPMVGSLNLKVLKARSATSVAVPSKARKNSRLSATVKVAPKPGGAPATGRVSVYVGSKKVKTVTLSSAADGVVKVRLPKMKSRGSKSVRATFHGSHNHGGSKGRDSVRIR